MHQIRRYAIFEWVGPRKYIKTIYTDTVIFCYFVRYSKRDLYVILQCAAFTITMSSMVLFGLCISHYTITYRCYNWQITWASCSVFRTAWGALESDTLGNNILVPCGPSIQFRTLRLLRSYSTNEGIVIIHQPHGIHYYFIMHAIDSKAIFGF